MTPRSLTDPAALPALRSRLANELDEARATLAVAQVDRERLRADLLTLRQQLAGACDELVSAEDRAGQLARQLAVVRQLHAAPDRGRLLQVFREVAADLLGAAALALLELVEGRLHPALAIGIEGPDLGALTAPDGPAGLVLSAAGAALRPGVSAFEPAPFEPAPFAPGPCACVPLTAAGEPVGALVVLRLAPHRPPLGEDDLALLALLGEHGGLAWRATRAAEAS
jgi:GAF domain-containing protein